MPGDATKEIWINGLLVWFNAQVDFMGEDAPFACRGEDFAGEKLGDIFRLGRNPGQAFEDRTFRIVLC